MGCVQPDGTLSASAASILKAVASAADVEEVAGETGLPLFRVRAAMRELAEADLVKETEGRYQATASGLELLAPAKS